MKLGLNSEAAALSGLFERFCELWAGITVVVGCGREVGAGVPWVPKTNGFANGFKEADLRPAERGGAVSTGRDGYGIICSDTVLEWTTAGS